MNIFHPLLRIQQAVTTWTKKKLIFFNGNIGSKSREGKFFNHCCSKLRNVIKIYLISSRGKKVVQRMEVMEIPLLNNAEKKRLQWMIILLLLRDGGC